MSQSRHDFSAVRRALQLVRVGSLSTYEQPDRRKVAEIVISLQRSQMILNPVVVDLGRGMLIDGHHRSKAFEWLGLSHIPCYDVDYLSRQVEVRDWDRVTTAPSTAVREAFGMLRGGPDGPWHVVASDATQVIARRSFENALDGSRHLEHLSMCLAALGHDVRLEASDASPDDRIRSRMEPVVGKAEVLAAIELHHLFSQEVNRHLVDGRPLGLDIPLVNLDSATAFNAYLDTVFERGAPASREPGHWHEGRFYEERVVTFTGAEASES